MFSRRSLVTGAASAAFVGFPSSENLASGTAKGSYVQMGTSITAGLRAPDAYRSPAIVGEMLGITAFNVGFEGSYVGPGLNPDADEFSLLRLSQAIAAG
jgi:hypothetical protein